MEKEELEFAKYYHSKIRPELMEVVDAQTLVFDKDSYLTQEVFDSEFKQDTVVSSVINKFKTRSDVGIKKYGTTMDRDDLSFMDWISNLQEELMDAVIYCEKIKKYEKTVTTTEDPKGN
jgi:hypothetical protein